MNDSFHEFYNEWQPTGCRFNHLGVMHYDRQKEPNIRNTTA